MKLFINIEIYFLEFGYEHKLIMDRVHKIRQVSDILKEKFDDEKQRTVTSKEQVSQ